MFKLKKHPNDPDPDYPSHSQHGAKHDISPLCILHRSQHNLSRKLIDKEALKVLYRLKDRGFKAYLVGGCVRDILLERTPKDFDVCTDARPPQVRKIFRNCRLIGRRFRLAHIIFKRNKIIEVSTFRRQPDVLPDTEDRRELTIESNRYYGTPVEDANRRDFTINALFYDINNFKIIDYVGGIDDLRKGIVRVIGDPCTRFYEDPVRMMRGIEFAARLGFRLDPNTFKAIKTCKEEILHGSPERIKEEIIAILMSGYAHQCFSLFLSTGLFHVLFNDFQPWEERQTLCLLDLLGKLDAEVAANRIAPDYLCLSAFLWPFISTQMEKEKICHLNDLDAIFRELINPFCYHFNIRIHCRHLIKEIYRTIWRMKRGTGYKGEFRMIRKDFFWYAMTLFRWLGGTGQIDAGLIKRWDARIEELHRPIYKKRKRPRRRRKKSRHKKIPLQGNP